MTTRVIQREFVVQPGTETLPAVTLAGSWSSFMNTYAVWPDNNNSVTIRRSIALQAGNYYVTGAVDNYGTVNINGQYNISLYNFDTNISRTSTGNSTLVYHPGGEMTITISATNTGGPRGVAVTISAQTLISISMGGYLYGIGDLVWSTRSPGILSTGRYQITMPFKANVTAYAWGAGGGGGGMDAGTIGGLGAPGLYNTSTFEVEKGDLVEVFVGKNGRGGSSNSGGAPGGPAGEGRIFINGEATQSFNGGNGTAAGPTPYSGGGGGGGGASGVLINNIPVLVAAGGAGGGGAGNDGNGSGQYARRDASVNNNAIGAYNPGALAVDITNTGSYTLNAGAQLNEYNYFGTLSAPPAATGTTKVVVFGWGSISSGAQTRTLTSNFKVNLLTSSVLTYYVNRGTESGWGQTPDSGEELTLQYSANGSTWITLETVPRNVSPNTWLIRSPQVPAGAKVPGGVFLRFRQVTQSASSSGKRDTWAFTSMWNGSPSLDFRGENGQAKGGDGGGAGGGGGGYPGGQGGAVAGGDASGYAGQCGGIYPNNVVATAGQDSPYYKPGYGAGGDRGGGNGQNGRVVLLIEPLSLNSVKISGEWKQIQEAFVKVSDSWKQIDAIYVKVDDSWKEINGTGRADITLAGNTQNYGTSTRSYS